MLHSCLAKIEANWQRGKVETGRCPPNWPKLSSCNDLTGFYEELSIRASTAEFSGSDAPAAAASHYGPCLLAVRWQHRELQRIGRRQVVGDFGESPSSESDNRLVLSRQDGSQIDHEALALDTTDDREPGRAQAPSSAAMLLSAAARATPYDGQPSLGDEPRIGLRVSIAVAARTPSTWASCAASRSARLRRLSTLVARSCHTGRRIRPAHRSVVAFDRRG